MAPRFEFPEGDDERVRSDCRHLEEILTRGTALHIAMLSAVGEAEELRPLDLRGIEWTDQNTESVLREGLYGAFSKNQISRLLLRRLAHDPVALSKLSERMRRAEPTEPKESKEVFGESYDPIEGAFNNLMGHLDLAQRNESVSPPPLQCLSGTGEVYMAHWKVPLTHHECTISVPVGDEEKIRLSSGGRTWGILFVRRKDRALAVVSRTGVFLHGHADEGSKSPWKIRIETLSDSIEISIKLTAEPIQHSSQAPHSSGFRTWRWVVAGLATAAAILVAVYFFPQQSPPRQRLIAARGGYDRLTLFEGIDRGQTSLPTRARTFFIGVRASADCIVRAIAVLADGRLESIDVDTESHQTLFVRQDVNQALGPYTVRDDVNQPLITHFLILSARADRSNLPTPDLNLRLSSPDRNHQINDLAARWNQDSGWEVHILPVGVNQHPQ